MEVERIVAIKVIPEKKIYCCDRCGFESENSFARNQYMHLRVEHAGMSYDGSTGGATHHWFFCGICVSDFLEWKGKKTP